MRMRPGIRKQSVADALAKRAAPPQGLRYRGVPYATVQEPTGVWLWKVLPANTMHAYDYTVASGFRPTRESAEIAAKMAIDTQLDC
jgi:hypothetical protein